MKFTIYGTPTAKGRPKAARRGRFVSMYTPEETKLAEESFIAQAIKHRPDTPLEGPLRVLIRFYKTKPKSYPKKKKDWIQKPDIDNLIKLVLDSMNRIFFKDDSQVVSIFSSKEFSDTPRTEVEIQKV